MGRRSSLPEARRWDASGRTCSDCHGAVARLSKSQAGRL